MFDAVGAEIAGMAAHEADKGERGNAALATDGAVLRAVYGTVRLLRRGKAGGGRSPIRQTGNP